MNVICIATPKQLKSICASGFLEQYGLYKAIEITIRDSIKHKNVKVYRIDLSNLPNHVGYIDLPKKLFMPYNEWIAKERERQIKDLFD